MNQQETQEFRTVVLNKLHLPRLTNDERVEAIFQYANGIVKIARMNDRFDAIERKRDDNIDECNRCLGCCFIPLRCCCKSGKVFGLMLFVILSLYSVLIVASYVFTGRIK